MPDVPAATPIHAAFPEPVAGVAPAPTLFGVAGVQMDVSVEADNIERMGRYLRHIRGRFPWVRMVMFSELAVHGPGIERAEPLPGPSEARLAELACETGLWLIPGSLFERVDEAHGPVIYNTTPVIDPTGVVVARFRKLFPFRPYERDVTGGQSFCVFDVPGVGRFGVSICYDMWFPETTRTLVAMGAEVILHPTMTDTMDRDVELAIARASAVTNQVWFLDFNGIGAGGVGRSIVCDPSGNVVHQCGHGPEVVPFEIDFARVRRERERGLLGNLGQPLKSFRDRECEFRVYHREIPAPEFGYLQSLGPLEKPL